MDAVNAFNMEVKFTLLLQSKEQSPKAIAN